MPIILNKPRGKTPLEVVTSWRKAHNVPSTTPLSYAGRLDPMAEGKLLILVGDECKEQNRYTKLDKEYQVEVLFGVRSDTGDVLGMPERAQTLPDLSKLQAVIQNEIGTHTRAYPSYSSKTVNGTPLFLHALQDTLSSIKIPTHEETIYKVTHTGTRSVSSEKLRARVRDILSTTPKSNEPSKLLGADFRIGSIVPAWEKLLTDEAEYHVLSLTVVCGTGTYMRTLAERIGESLGSYGLALSINRTKIGRYRKWPFGFWLKAYR